MDSLIPVSPAQIDYRTLAPEEFQAFADNLDLAFHEGSTPDKRDQWRALLPFERTVAAFDGPLLVGTSASYAQRMSVPGGELACAGVTVVTVRPTHRRRGILTGMMSILFERAQAAGEPLAALWAAEGGIYERFGYGVAGQRAHIVLPGGAGAPRPSLRAEADHAPAAAQTHALELIDTAGAGPLLDPVWERLRALRPGIPARTALWWRRRVLSDLPENRGGALQKRLLVARDGAGTVQGYALYRARGEEPDTTLEVLELIAPDPDAEAALWGLLGSIDLVATVDAPMRPVDDAAQFRFADFRQPRVVDVTDGLWLRLIDLPAALQGRAWRGPLDLTLEVADARLPANAGRWRLQVSADGEARCSATQRDPDLQLDVAALSAAYLGGTGVARLADAGRVVERSPGAVELLGAALHVPRAPWTPEFF